MIAFNQGDIELDFLTYFEFFDSRLPFCIKKTG